MDLGALKPDARRAAVTALIFAALLVVLFPARMNVICVAKVGQRCDPVGTVGLASHVLASDSFAGVWYEVALLELAAAFLMTVSLTSGRGRKRAGVPTSPAPTPSGAHRRRNRRATSPTSY